MRQNKKAYRREHWRKWYHRDLVHIGYWPQYRAWQTEWVRFDVKKIVRQMVEGRIDVLDWGVPENWYPVDGGFSKRHPALMRLDYDPFQELVAECHRHGKKILFYLATNAVGDGQFDYFNNHKEVLRWQGVNIRDDENVPTHFRLCLENPGFLNPFFETVRLLARTYEFDGLVVDGPWADEHIFRPGGVKDGRFTCRFCRTSYARFAGRARVPTEDWNDLAWHRLRAWRSHYVGAFHCRLTSLVKRIDERLFLAVNNVAMPNQSRMDPNEVKGAIRLIQMETSQDGLALLEPAMKMKLGWALTDKTPGNYHKSADLQHYGLADAEPSYTDVATLAYSGLMHGAWLGFHSSMDQRAEPHPLRTRVYQRVGREIAGKKNWLTHSEPVPHVGIVYSSVTRERYAGANNVLFRHAFHGAERLVVESHVYSGYVLDRQLRADFLKRFGCLILPNVACLSAAAIAAIRAYVRAGGGLIATAETSLYDENERFRGDFGLADVFGAHFAGANPRARTMLATEPNWKKYPYRLRPHPITAGFGPADLGLTWLPYFSITRADDRETLATWPTLEENTIWPVNGGRYIKAETNEPCMVAGQFGRGRVVYISGDFTSFYVSHSMHDLRRLFGRMLEWAAPAPVRVVAPKCVEMSVVRQPGRRHLIVHLLNAAVYAKTNGNMLAMGGYFDAQGRYVPHAAPETRRYRKREDMPTDLASLALKWRIREGAFERAVCDENVPVHNVRIVVNLRHGRVVKAMLAPQMKPLRMRENAGGLEITVPRVDIHQMVLLEQRQD